MSLILRPPWTRQPQWAVGVDWGHPLAQGLVAWLPGNGLFYDATRRASVTLAGNPQFGTYSDGRLGALRAPAWDGTDDEVSFGTFPLLTTFSLLAWWYEPSTPPADGYRAIIRRGEVFGTNANFVFGGRYRTASSEPRFFCFARKSGTLLGGESSFGGNLTQGAWNRIGVSWRNGEQKLYLNGRVVSTFAYGDPGDSSDPLAFGGLGDSLNGTRIATAAFDARVYNRVLSAGEFAADYAGSPYAIFAPRRIWVPVSAGSGTQTLTPDLFTNSNTFYTHTVTTGAVTLTPDLFTNTNSFYTPTVSSSYTVTPNLFTNTNTFYTPVVTNLSTLYPDLFTNSQTFYTHVVTGGGGQTLEPELFSNSQTFYGPTVTVGTVTLAPSLFTNTNDIYSHVVTSNYTLTPALFSNSSSFYTSTISVGAVTLTPSLFTNSSTFYTHTISNSSTTIYFWKRTA